MDNTITPPVPAIYSIKVSPLHNLRESPPHPPNQTATPKINTHTSVTSVHTPLPLPLPLPRRLNPDIGTARIVSCPLRGLERIPVPYCFSLFFQFLSRLVLSFLLRYRFAGGTPIEARIRVNRIGRSPKKSNRSSFYVPTI